MKSSLAATLCIAVVFLTGCSEFRDSQAAQDEQLRRSMLGPNANRSPGPPVSEPTPPPQPVPGE